MKEETKKKVLQTIEILVKAGVAIAAIWLAVSCTMSMSVSKNNTNSNQQTEQVNKVDSTKIYVPRETIRK